MGSVGVEPTPTRLKDVYAAVTPQPRTGWAVQVGREALESSSAVLQTAARPSQLPAQKKKARHLLVTPGLASRFQESSVASQARRMSGEAIRPLIRRMPGRFALPRKTIRPIHRSLTRPLLESLILTLG